MVDAECSAFSKANVVALSQKFKVGEGFTIAVSFPKGYVNQSAFLPHYKMEEFLSLEKISDRRFSCSDLFPLFCFLEKHGNDASVQIDLKKSDLKSTYSATALQYLSERSVNTTTLLTTIISLSLKGAEITSNDKESWQDGLNIF
jgi:hypothetical protein